MPTDFSIEVLTERSAHDIPTERSVEVPTERSVDVPTERSVKVATLAVVTVLSEALAEGGSLSADWTALSEGVAVAWGPPTPDAGATPIGGGTQMDVQVPSVALGGCCEACGRDASGMGGGGGEEGPQSAFCSGSGSFSKTCLIRDWIAHVSFCSSFAGGGVAGGALFVDAPFPTRPSVPPSMFPTGELRGPVMVGVYTTFVRKGGGDVLAEVPPVLSAFSRPLCDKMAAFGSTKVDFAGVGEEARVVVTAIEGNTVVTLTLLLGGS